MAKTWERRLTTGIWEAYSPRFGKVGVQSGGRKSGGKWYLLAMNGHEPTMTLGVYDSKKEAQDAAFSERNPSRRRRFRTRPRIARVSARGRRRTRKANPIPRGKALRESFTLSTLRAVKLGGRAEKIWYEDARDNKHYYHDFDGAQGAIMYLCESAAVGKCVLIVSGDLATPLWEDA